MPRSKPAPRNLPPAATLNDFARLLLAIATDHAKAYGRPAPHHLHPPGGAKKKPGRPKRATQ